MDDPIMLLLFSLGFVTIATLGLTTERGRKALVGLLIFSIIVAAVWFVLMATQ